MTCIACCLAVWDGVKCQKEDGLDKILEGVFLELDWMDYPPLTSLPPKTNKSKLFSGGFPSVGSSLPGIPVSGSRDARFPGCTIFSPNAWRTFGTKLEHFKSPNCQILPFRINPIDTDTQSLTCNPSQNEGCKKEISPSRYFQVQAHDFRFHF